MREKVSQKFLITSVSDSRAQICIFISLMMAMNRVSTIYCAFKQISYSCFCLLKLTNIFPIMQMQLMKSLRGSCCSRKILRHPINCSQTEPPICSYIFSISSFMLSMLAFTYSLRHFICFGLKQLLSIRQSVRASNNAKLIQDLGELYINSFRSLNL